MQVQSLGEKDPLEEEMATNSSILARIPWDCKESDTTEHTNNAVFFPFCCSPKSQMFKIWLDSTKYV